MNQPAKTNGAKVQKEVGTPGAARKRSGEDAPPAVAEVKEEAEEQMQLDGAPDNSAITVGDEAGRPQSTGPPGQARHAPHRVV